MTEVEVLRFYNPTIDVGRTQRALDEAREGRYMELIEQFNVSRRLVNALRSQGLSDTLIVEEVINQMRRDITPQ